MSDPYARRNIRERIQDIVRRTPDLPEDPKKPDLPPPPPARGLLPHQWRRRVGGTLVLLLVGAVLVVGVTGGSAAWRFARTQLNLAHLVGVKPIASHVLPQKEGPYPKTLAGLAAYVQDLFSNAQDLLRPTFRIAGEAQTLVGLLPQALSGTHGDELIASLKRLRDAFAAFNTNSSEQVESANIGANIQEGFDFLHGHTRDAEALLTAAIDWLEAGKPHHVAILFGNTAEMRPGGGFVGSYADVTVDHGAVTDITVHDINDVDRGLDANYIPPLELQALVRRWRTADANWYFNFPDSAQQIIRFMNASHLYADRSIKIDGVIAISPQVIESILKSTGPITLADGTEITADNFLHAIQSEVQEGHDTGSDHPKAVLAELVPRIMQKITAEGENSTSRNFTLIDSAFTGLGDKGITAYFTDQNLQTVIDRYGWSGRLYDLPRNFVGDYVGVTMSNIGGAKTDVVIKNNIAIHENVLPSGLLETRVTLTRDHNGNNEKEWWYKAPYQGYVQIFTPPGVDVLTASGMWDRPSVARSYGSDFTTDPLAPKYVKSQLISPQFAGLMASTQSGRNVLGFWQHFDAGTTAKADLDYVRPLPDPALPGAHYTFVIEKQPASSAHYDVDITAPPGFTWKENGKNVYSYSTDDLPARLVLPLTLTRTDTP